jgi:hypothetical protein
MKSGAAKLEVSPSHFILTIKQFPGNKETGLSSSPSTVTKFSSVRKLQVTQCCKEGSVLGKNNLVKSSSSPYEYL